MTTISTVAPNELIESAWGNSVATVCNNELVRKAGSTMTGRLILADVAPNNDNEATRKIYVDNQVQNAKDAANAGLTDKLAKAGGAMVAPGQGGTGINMNNATIYGLPAPSDDGHATRKSYVDAQVGTALLKSGGTMTGDLNMNNQALFNVPDPSGPQSAANQRWCNNTFEPKSASDYRLKDIVGDVSNAVDRLVLLLPRRVRWRDTGIEVDGFIAHEVSDVVPNAVTGTKDGPVMQTLDVRALVPLVVAAVQELVGRVVALEGGR